MKKDTHQDVQILRQQVQKIERSASNVYGLKPVQPKEQSRLLVPANDDKGKSKLPSLPPLAIRATGTIATQLPELTPQFTSDLLTQSAMHEVTPKSYGDPASLSFLMLALKMQTKQADKQAPILWCTTQYQSHEIGSLFAPGLIEFDIDPNRIIFVRAKNDTELLWVLEEALRSKSFQSIVGHIQDLSFTQTRRLSLATQSGATPLFLHRPHHCHGSSAAHSRWQIESQPSHKNPFDERAPGARQLRANLIKSRSGQTGSWSLEYETSSYPLLMVPAPANRKFTPQMAPRKSVSTNGGQGFAS